MTRWRLSAWFDDRPKVVLRKQVQHSCKLCVIARAMDLASLMETTHRRKEGSARWLVEYLDGGIQGWHVKYSDQSRVGEWVKRHGH